MLIRESEETRAYFSTLTRIDEAISELTVEKAENQTFTKRKVRPCEVLKTK